MADDLCTSAPKKRLQLGKNHAHNLSQTHMFQHKARTEPQNTAANLFLVTHLADHCGSGSQSGSLYALVGSLSSKASEELVTMDGFPSFW